MAEVASESWWIKVGILYDKSGFKSLIGGMLDINKLASGMYDAFKKVVSINSDMYNTSKYLNVASKELQIWERVFKDVGGSVDDAHNAIESLNFVMSKIRLGSDTNAPSIAARLGLSPEDLSSFDRALRALNRAYNEHWKSQYGEFRELASQLGLSQSAMLVVTQSVDDFQKSLRVAQDMPIITDRQLKSARELERSFNRLKTQWDLFKTELVSTSLPGLNKLMGRFESIMKDPELRDSLKEFFQELEQAIDTLVTSENVNKLIDILEKITRYGSKTIAGTAKAVSTGLNVYSTTNKLSKENTGKGVGTTLVDMLPISHVGKAVGSAVGTVYNVVNQAITVNGAKDPEAVGQAVADVGKRELSDANANARTVANTREKSSL